MRGQSALSRRPYVLIDLYGNMNALPKLIDDKSVRTADIRAFLEKDYPVESLPSIEEAEKLVAAHRKLIERSLNEDRYATRLADLKRSQQERRASVEREGKELSQRQQQDRLAQQREHLGQRKNLRTAHIHAMREVRAARQRNRPTGLAAFLGWVSGVELIRKALHRYEDGKRLKVCREHRAELKIRRGDEARTLDTRLAVQAQEAGRGAETPAPDLLSSFAKAKQSPRTPVPDLMSAFERAAGGRDASNAEDGSHHSGLDGYAAPDGPSRHGTDAGPEKKR